MTTGKDAVNHKGPSWVYNWLNSIQSGLFPARCCLCGRPGKHPFALCGGCLSDLPWLNASCPRCGIPATNPGQLCGRCQNNPPPFDRTLALFHYQPPISQLIQQFKFNDRLTISRLLSQLMIERLERETSLPEAILPVPLHPRRQRERGFNQAIELARPIAKYFDIPLLANVIARHRYTDTQTSLDAKQRRKNLRGAFKAEDTINYMHIAIMDDVITTGTTIRELAKTLNSAGTQQIDCWAIAKTGQ